MSEHLKIMEESNSFLLIAHKSPDIDSMSSALALAIALKRRGKTVSITAQDTSIQMEKFMKQFGFKLSKPNYNVECIVVLDTNSPALFDLESVKKSNAKKIIIDHHATKEHVIDNFDAQILNEKAVSTTQIMYSILTEWTEPITKEIALLISAGIVTDSANFIAATPEAFKIIGDSLLSTNTSFQEVLKIIRHPIESSEKMARLKGAQRLQFVREGDYIIAFTKISSFEGSVARSLLNLGADVSFVGAAKNNEVRLSARARNELLEKGFHLGRDVLPEIAELIGGDAGGHAGAAGANGINEKELDKALSMCVEKTQKFIRSI